MHPEDKDFIAQTEPFRALIAMPGWSQLVGAAQQAVYERWKALLSCKPDELKYHQGFIDGANHVLEYADAELGRADQLLAEHQREQRQAVEDSRLQERFVTSERNDRRLRMGARISIGGRGD